MNYRLVKRVLVYGSAIALLVKAALPVAAIDTHRGGCRDNRIDNCAVSAKDDGGYVPPNNGHPDCNPCLGTGTRLY